MCMIGNKAQNW